MRRFEYKDQTSDKFWEIEQENCDLHTHWGRIGTNGQSKTKSFASEAKAQAAMTKQIEEKTAKGYIEVSTDGQSISKTQPKPESVQVAVPEKPISEEKPAPVEIQKTTAIPSSTCNHAVNINKDQPLWLQEQPTVTIPSGKDWTAPWPSRKNPPHQRIPHQRIKEIKPPLWEDIGKHFLNNFKIDTSLSSTCFHTTLKELEQRFKEPATSQKSSKESDILLMAIALSENDYYYRETDASLLILIFLLKLFDLEYIIELVLEAEKITVEYDYRYGFNKRKIFFKEDSSESILLGAHYYKRFLSEGEVYIRQSLSNAPEDQWQNCVKIINEQIDTLPPIRQAIVALMVPDAPELSHKVARHLLSLSKIPFTIKGLLLTTTEEEIIDEIIKAKPVYFSPYEIEQSEILSSIETANTLFVEKQENALDILLPKVTNDHCGFLIAHINDPHAIQALAIASQKGDKKCMANFQLALKNWPTTSIIALTQLLADARKDYDFARLALIQLTTQYPEKLPAILSWLEEPAANILTTIINQSAQVEEANLNQLPEMLITPPWTIKRAKIDRTVFELEPLPVAPTELWIEKEKNKILNKDYYYHKKGKLNTIENILYEAGFRAGRYKPFLDKAVQAAKNENTEQFLTAFDELFQNKKENQKSNYGNYICLSMEMLAKLPQQLAVALFNRFSEQFESMYHLDYFAAKFGLATLPGIISAIKRFPGEYIYIASTFGSTELAPIMARAFHKLKTQKEEGRNWLLKYPQYAIHALIAPALGKKGEGHECAAAALRLLNSQGYHNLIIETANKYQNPDITTALEALLNENELDLFPTKIPSLPALWQPATWNRPVLANGIDTGKSLPISAINHIGTMLAFPVSEEGWYAGLYEVKKLCTPESLAAFAWDMFNTWLNHGAPSKDKWAFLSLGIFGNDDIARKLTPYIREWPGMAAHARAVMGLDVLAEIGTDIALMQLNGIAQKVKFKGLQDKAREKIDQIAEKLGLTREELEDRLAPDFGLNEQGSLLLDFGPRQFIVGFDETLKPYIRDTNGKRLTNLPKPGKSDDENLANEASERFKNLKKDVRTVASQQIMRLEHAMCTRRRWETSNFEIFIAQHPLLRHLATRLVWAAYEMTPNSKGQIDNYGGQATAFFRLSEDGSYTTAQDDPFDLPDGEKNIRIGLPHILELPAEVGAEFGQLFTDYELIQPFAQLGRETFVLKEEEKTQTALTRWKDIKIPTGRLISLTNKGWRKGTPQDAGWVGEIYKDIGKGQGIVLNMSEGYCVGYTEMDELQTIENLEIGPMNWDWEQVKEPLQLQRVDPIIISELIRDMELITKK